MDLITFEQDITGLAPDMVYQLRTPVCSEPGDPPRAAIAGSIRVTALTEQAFENATDPELVVIYEDAVDRHVVESFRSADGNYWVIRWFNGTEATLGVTVSTLCVSVPDDL